jgi:hypothetical protein
MIKRRSQALESAISLTPTVLGYSKVYRRRMYMKSVIQKYVLFAVLMVLINDDTRVVLFGVSNLRMSLRTRSLPTWYTSLELAMIRANGLPIVRTHITKGMLVDHAIVAHPHNLGSSVVLKHGVRRYAQRNARKVGV